MTALFGSQSDAYLSIMDREREREAVLENGKGFSRLIQPLSCFRGLLDIFSLPPSKTDSWYRLWTRTGEGRSPELSLRSCRRRAGKGQAALSWLYNPLLGDTWQQRLLPGRSWLLPAGDMPLQVVVCPQLTTRESRPGPAKYFTLSDNVLFPQLSVPKLHETWSVTCIKVLGS